MYPRRPTTLSSATSRGAGRSTAVRPHVPPVRQLGVVNQPIVVVDSDGDDSEIEEVGPSAPVTTATTATVSTLSSSTVSTPSLTMILGNSEEELWRQVPNIPEPLMVQGIEAASAAFAAVLLAEAIEAAEALLVAAEALTLSGDNSTPSASLPSDSDNAEASTLMDLTSTTSTTVARNPAVEEGGNDEIRLETPEDYINHAFYLTRMGRKYDPGARR
ncbi:hypothetical protein BDN72DRAFT_864295 [Pluteus cervinus]|uniref:Uncharacterized protein n=1 Tax=Pluteus cervinus TaxID=181527 RepID=A0ACD3A4D3_9AGAR|nr:hypothetical protein BDN72DRAFT_864295 [Pluteus cervinus]